MHLFRIYAIKQWNVRQMTRYIISLLHCDARLTVYKCVRDKHVPVVFCTLIVSRIDMYISILGGLVFSVTPDAFQLIYSNYIHLTSL